MSMSFAVTSMTTREFAEKAGVSASTVSKWLRSGKIKGRKKGGKWMIPQSEWSKIETRPGESFTTSSGKPSPAPSRTGETVFTIERFSEMTYLTEFGVRKWLREGKLQPAVDDAGNPGVDAANLDKPSIKRLIR
jgi:excisionase family DNA binding protein